MEIQQPQNQKAELRTAVPGPRSSELRKQEDRNLSAGLQGFALMAGIVVDHARGSAVTDVDGNTFLDLIGGIGVNGLGHSHPKWVEAVQAQVARASVGSLSSEPRIRLLQQIAHRRPAEDLHRTQFYSGGSEAVESALRLAKSYTGKYEFVSFWGGFHGKTMGSLSLMGSDFKTGNGPMVSGSHLLPYPDTYRCPFRGDPKDSSGRCLEFLRNYLKCGTAGQIAGIIVEPMQGTAGNVIPPKEFLPGLREIADEIGALLIVDEMITGFGRTGRYWGIDHSGVKPDILTIGKQFGGGFPMSGLISRDEIVESRPWGNPSGSSSSYGGNPLGAAAASAAIQIIEDEDLVGNSQRVGEYFLQKLKPFEEEYPFVGQVRGLGLFLGIDLVRDQKTKEPASKAFCQKVFDGCLKRGLLTMAYAPRFRMQPAMTIDTGTVDEALGILTEVFDELRLKRAHLE